MRHKEFRYILISLVVSIIVTAGKFIAYFKTGSVAVLSDALESIINVLAALFACYSVYLTAKPRDKNHPYGHGKVEFFSIGFEGGMITIAGLLILYNAVDYFISPRTLNGLNSGIIILAVTGLINLLLGLFLIRSGKKLPSITISGNGQHIITDAWSSLGVIIVLVLITITGWQWLDPLASLIMGLLIITKGYTLLRKSVSGLMDETDLKVVDQIVTILSEKRKSQWIDVHNLRIQQFGNNLHIDCHVSLPYYYTLEEVHREVKKIEKVLNDYFPKREVECFIHTDPCCPPLSCPYCPLSECKVRKAPFEKKIAWTKERILSNRQHFKKE